MFEGNENFGVIKEGIFGKAEVNDVVWSPKFGWGRIKKITTYLRYPILILFSLSKTEQAFNCDGKSMSSSIHPEIFWDAFEVPNKALVRPEPISWQWLYSSNGKMYLTYKHFSTKDQVIAALGESVKILNPVLETISKR